MSRSYVPFFLFVLFAVAKVFPQNQNIVTVLWDDNKTVFIGDSTQDVLHFKGAFYCYEDHKSPIFKKKIRLPENVLTAEVNVNNIDSIPFSDLESRLFRPSKDIEMLNWRISYERKTPFLSIFYIPLTTSHKITQFSYSIRFTYSDYDIKSPKIAVENSVLNEGDWYRFKVSDDGLFKLDAAAFEEMGVSISSIDPQKIQVYGNGGAMLPEYNGTFRFDDLEENAIYVYGEDDGVFNTNDFVVFYGQSPHRWEYDTLETAFVHKLNIYDNNNYYYVHIGEENGKRIQNVNSSSNPTYEVDFHTETTFYEWENQNLIHAGRQWFGEYFSFNEQYNINFNFTDRIKSEPIRIKARAVARSSSATSLSCKLSGSEVLLVPIGVNISSKVYVDEGESSAEFTTNQTSIGLNVSYNNNGNSTAFAYLDYIELQAKCSLNYNGGQLFFKEPSTVSPGRESKFLINSNLSSFSVWDVTNPTNVINVNTTSFSSFTSSTSVLKTFVLHDLVKSSYRNPVFDKKITNQNLHGQETAELLIITAPEFLEAAERLAEFHIVEDGMSVNIATTDQIYNEFSSGKQDLIALRDYVKMFYNNAQTVDEIPKNVLLFGDASFDYKGITASNGLYNDVNFVPTFQAENSFEIGDAFCTDDFIAYLDSNEGAQNTMHFDGVDIGVGRIVCQTLTEAQGVVDKIINYNSVNSLGDWRSNICFVADDVDDENWEFRLQENIDKIAKRIDTTYANYNVNKVYLDAYQQIASSGGQRYPEARQAIIDHVNKGTLMMHYYGHGGEVGWAEERVLELIDINTWKNMNNLAVFVTATCEFSRYDDAKRVSAGEQILLNPEGAGIALFTTTRTITEGDAQNLSSTFYEYAIPENTGENLSFGEIMAAIKNDLNVSGISARNKMKFTLLGDPSLKFPIPENNIFVTEIIDALSLEPIDTLKALSKVIVRGKVTDANNIILNSFNGLLKSKVYDKPSSLQTLNNDFEYLEPFNFELQQNVLYSGNVTVDSGLFEFEFVVPKDIAYAYGLGKVSLYAHNNEIDAIGSHTSVVIGGYDENALTDDFGPDIDLYMNDVSFREGGITNSNPRLYAEVTDDSGINTTGNGIGHDIVAVLDENTQDAIVLNHYYDSNLDSYQSGTVSYPFSNLSEGLHSLRIKVWDVHNNSAEDFTEFLVVADEGLILSNLMNYPNPFSDFTRFHFEHNQAGEDLEVFLNVYDFEGRKVKTISETIYSSSFSNSEFIWDGRSEGGGDIKSGVYICKLSALNLTTKEENTISTQMVLIK